MAGEPNELNDRPEVKPEDRKVLVITEGAYTKALEMESLDKQLGDLQERALDVSEQLQILQAKRKQLEGKRDEQQASFWKDVRADHKQWFRDMTDAGLHITYKRSKDPETGKSMGVELNAIDPQEESYKLIRKIFRRNENERE